MTKPIYPLRSGNGYDTLEASKESWREPDGPSLTIQSQKTDADINVILKNFGVTGQLPQVANPPTYDDFSAVQDYRDAQELILAANAAFMELPATVRTKFRNDPAAFVDFCSDPANRDAIKELGLLEAASEIPTPNPPSPAVTPPAASGAATGGNGG